MLEKPATYLDANASQPLADDVKRALTELLADAHRTLLNPSSLHVQGRASQSLLRQARDRLGAVLGDPAASGEGRILFTSSCTEGNQTVIRSELTRAFQERPRDRVSWLLSEAEHESVEAEVPWARERGIDVERIPLQKDGLLDLQRLQERVASKRPDLVSLCGVNAETGVVQLMAKVREAVNSAPLHWDMAQALGKVPSHLLLGISRAGGASREWMTFSSHKLGAPAGVGAVWRSRKTQSPLPLLKGTQERGVRGGTENALGIFAFGAALEALQHPGFEADLKRIEDLRDALQAQVLERLSGVRVHGASAPRVGNTLNLGFEGIEAPGLVEALDLEGFSVSSGSACASKTQLPSRTLLAMGLPEGAARGAIRISLWKGVHPEELERFVGGLEKVVTRFRGTLAR